jgi:UDP:flavonoid glycosyltransferase YjiC (YdhE family)
MMIRSTIMQQQILVTGASGVIGRAFVAQLVSAGHMACAMSRRLPRPDDVGVSWVQADLVTGVGLAEAVADVQTIVHAAAELVDFLEAGAPPIYIGFGSMAGRNTAATTNIVIGALRQAGMRGRGNRHWGLQVGEESNNIFVLDQVPHDWVFPRMAAIVHHGGEGTTAAAFRAGRPQRASPISPSGASASRRLAWSQSQSRRRSSWLAAGAGHRHQHDRRDDATAGGGAWVANSG